MSSQIGITSLQASVGGNPIALSYPGTCQLAAANSAGRVAVICPNASAVLASSENTLTAETKVITTV